MVAVALDHAAQQSYMLVVDARKAVFFQHEYSEAVAGVKHLRRHRVMTGTVGVHAHFLKFAQAVSLKRIGDGGSHPGMILVHVDTLQLHGAVVEQKSLVGVKTCIADTGYGGI